MGSPQFFTYLLVMALLASCKLAIAQTDAFDGAERDALLALKDGFNSSFLERNWKGIMCYMNDPPKWYGIKCVDGRVSEIVLESLELTGKIKLDALFNLTQLSVISFKKNSISGNLMDFSYNPKLKQIDLSGNIFDGLISDSLLNFNFLESLQLQDNNLTGSVPAFNQSSLREFNVSDNRLSGQIPSTPVLKSFNSSSFAGNPELCGPPSSAACKIGNNDNNTSDSNGHHKSSRSSLKYRLVATFVVVDVIVIVVLVFLFITYYKKSKKLKREMEKRNYHVQQEVEKKIETVEKSVAEREERGKLTFMNNEVSFEIVDLLKASAEGLGRGNFGNSYRARLDDGKAVVVKRLRDLKPLSHDEFAKHLQAISDQKHPNLLPLLAYYYSKEEKLLIYRFASNGNVYNRLHGGRGTKDRIPFRWSARLSVARCVARALEYLHLNPNSQAIVPHGNLKSSNVLLDENDTVLVSDHGLSSLVALPIAAKRMVSYQSPEYQTHKKVSEKSDVWSYGCLLLELLTGRVNGVDLGSWVHRAVREEWTAEIFDVEISGQRRASHAMLRLLEIAVRCCDKLPEKRPEMREVAREVEDIKGVVDSEDDDDSSLTDDSMSATPSMCDPHSTLAFFLYSGALVAPYCGGRSLFPTCRFDSLASVCGGEQIHLLRIGTSIEPAKKQRERKLSKDSLSLFTSHSQLFKTLRNLPLSLTSHSLLFKTLLRFWHEQRQSEGRDQRTESKYLRDHF